MPCATVFLPCHIIELINFSTNVELYTGSCGTSRISTRRLRGISIPAAYAFGRFAPYFDRLCLRLATPAVSSAPRIRWYRTPGKSFTRPPRISTMECSCRLWPTPGIYVVTSMPLVSRTRATFRSAELGFFGVEVYTRVQTPRFCGQLCSAGLAVFQRGGLRPLRTSWLKVGTNLPLSSFKLEWALPARQKHMHKLNGLCLRFTTARITVRTGPYSNRG